ncbi:MAG: hypothetical protein ACK4K7_04180 [Allosphingosinicella sp.]
MEKLRLEVDELPELETKVGVSGSSKQQEVGGAVCIGIICGVIIYS